MPTHLISCMGLEELLTIKMLCAKGDKKDFGVIFPPQISHRWDYEII